MNTKNTVFSRLFGKQFKSELSASDDIQTAINDINALDLESGLNELRSSESDLNNVVSQAQSIARDFLAKYDGLEDVLNGYRDKRDQLEQALVSFDGMATDLGIDPEQSEAYRRGQEAFTDAENKATDISSLQNELFELYELANELNR
jgi:FtsZ-binding cell division protein ZapB